MKLFPAKCHEWATLQKLWWQTGNSSLLPAKCDRCCIAKLDYLFFTGLTHLLCASGDKLIREPIKSLNNWSLGEQWALFPSNLNVSLDFISGNIEILGKQNSLFPSGPVIKCLLLSCSIGPGFNKHPCPFYVGDIHPHLTPPWGTDYRFIFDKYVLAIIPPWF